MLKTQPRVSPGQALMQAAHSSSALLLRAGTVDQPLDDLDWSAAEAFRGASGRKGGAAPPLRLLTLLGGAAEEPGMTAAFRQASPSTGITAVWAVRLHVAAALWVDPDFELLHSLAAGSYACSLTAC